MRKISGKVKLWHTIKLKVGATRCLRELWRVRCECEVGARSAKDEGGCDIYKEAIGPAGFPSDPTDLLGDMRNGLWNGIVLWSGDENETLAAPRPACSGVEGGLIADTSTKLDGHGIPWVDISGRDGEYRTTCSSLPFFLEDLDPKPSTILVQCYVEDNERNK